MMGHNSSDKTTQLLTRLVSIHNKTNLQYFQRLLFAQFSIVNPSQESLYLGLSHRLCSKANDAYFSLVFLFLISNKQNLTSSSSSSSTNSTLVTDLIYSFTNINSSSFSFSNKINLHVPSSAIISRLLLLSQNYLEISHSLTLPLNGIIHHSLIALLNSSLADFNRLVAVLHGNNLTLIRLLLWTRNPLSRLETINNLLKSTSTLKGGALLSFLFQGVSHGNPSISVFYNHLVTECFKPFAKLCVDWMEQGSIYDPTNEFFVKIISGKHLNVWKNRDVLVNDMIPSFMSESTIQQVFYNNIDLFNWKVNLFHSKCMQRYCIFNYF